MKYKSLICGSFILKLHASHRVALVTQATTLGVVTKALTFLKALLFYWDDPHSARIKGTMSKCIAFSWNQVKLTWWSQKLAKEVYYIRNPEKAVGLFLQGF